MSRTYIFLYIQAYNLIITEDFPLCSISINESNEQLLTLFFLVFFVNIIISVKLPITLFDVKTLQKGNQKDTYYSFIANRELQLVDILSPHY